MNRIRNHNGLYQVLITPSIKISPDSSLMVGNWEDEELRNFHVLEFDTLRDAQCEAFEHPDIDWYRLVLNHKHIYIRLKGDLQKIIRESGINVEFLSNLMEADTFKNIIFNRVINNGERFNLKHDANDIISFTIVNPWTSNLNKLSKLIEFHREHLYRNDLRIKSKTIVDKKIIYLYGYTEFGTIYEIKLLPTLIYQWSVWYLKHGYRNEQYADKLYKKYVKMQSDLDNGPVLR
jgi:hypothetical protein